VTNRNLFGGAVMCLGVLCAAPAAAEDCAARVVAVENTTYTVGGGGFDIFARSIDAERLTIALEGAAAADCQLAVTLSSDVPGGSTARLMTSTAGDRFPFIVTTDSAGQVRLEDSAIVTPNSAVRVGELVAGQRQSVDLYFAPAAGDQDLDRLRSGLYAAPLVARVYSTAGGTTRLLHEYAFPLTIPVKSVQEVRVSSRPSTFDEATRSALVDFGELESGETANAYVQVRSTSAYDLAFNSAEGWRLRSAQGGEVGYTTMLDLQPLRAAGNDATGTGRPAPTGRAGQEHELTFQVGATAAQPAGEYRDTILVRVIPIE
jgi:hypothetical protein